MTPVRVFLIGAVVLLGCALIATGVVLGTYIARCGQSMFATDNRRPMQAQDMISFYRKTGIKPSKVLDRVTAVTPHIRNNVYNARLHYLLQTGTKPLVKQSLITSHGAWTPLPISPTGRHWYNPTFVPSRGPGQEAVMLMRDDNIDEIWTAEATYVGVLWSMSAMSARGYPFHLDVQGLRLASCRQRASASAVVLEDLRYVPDMAGSPGFADNRRYVAGAAYCAFPAHSTKFVLLEVSDDGRALKRVAELQSPTGSHIEKNWQIMRSGEHEFTVIYNIQPRLAVYKFSFNEPALTLVHESPEDLALPRAWTSVARNSLSKCSKMRLSGILPIQKSSKLMLLTHVRGMLPNNSVGFLNFALCLDTATWTLERFLPAPTLAHIGVGIRYVMGGVEDLKRKKVHLMVGIADRVAGVQSFPRQEWWRQAVPFS